MRHKNITGADVVARALRKLPQNAAEEIAWAINKSGEELRDRAKRLAPERAGGGDLKRAIEMRDMEYREVISPRWRNPSRRFGVRVGVFPDHNGGKAWYARYLEFGTSQGIAKGEFSFLFPAYWSLRRRLRGRINRAIRKAARETFRRGRR